MAFSWDHVRWQLRHWPTALFTEEGEFLILTCDWRCRAWRPREGCNDGNIIQYDRYRWGSVMVRAGICFDGRTELRGIDRGSPTAIWYRDEIVDPNQELLPVQFVMTLYSWKYTSLPVVHGRGLNRDYGLTSGFRRFKSLWTVFGFRGKTYHR